MLLDLAGPAAVVLAGWVTTERRRRPLSTTLLATRNTCFALISAIETDFRSALAYEFELVGRFEVLPIDVREAALRRFQLDQKASGSGASGSDLDLFVYADFADISKTINANKDVLAGTPAYQSVAKLLDPLTPVRNRVCHSRPLEPDDFARCMDAAVQLQKLEGIPWRALNQTLKDLKTQPSSVLQLEIPDYWSADESRIHHNLPLPEFDDTGFLGRADDRLQVTKLLMTHHPVITLVGEGGIGKTALALRCLYDMLDLDKRPYDAIIWSSLKTTRLTASGVVQISTAISNTLGVMTTVAEALGTPSSSSEASAGLLNEILEYMRQYKVLVAIDNLETIQGPGLRDFLLEVPPGSKVLLTSRVGLGELEVRYQLKSLDAKTAISLLRKFAKFLEVGLLYKASDNVLERYSKALFLNPLLIKWFVSSVSGGGDPKNLVDHKATTLQSALDFCFGNVFDNLDEEEKRVLHVLTACRQPLSSAEVSFLSGSEEPVRIEWALSRLLSRCLVRREMASTGVLRFQLTEPALAHIVRRRPPGRSFEEGVQKRLGQLRILAQEEQRKQSAYKYDIRSIRAKSGDERIAAIWLRRALDSMDRGDFEDARRSVEQAKQLLPDYCEVWRISGIVESRFGESHNAREQYDEAVKANPRCALCRYSFSLFLMRQYEDFDSALVQLRAAEDLDKGDPTLRSAIAYCLLRNSQYGEAARVYEDLLQSLADRPRRWRLSTRDQAADCYSRWGEFDIKNRDFEGFRDHLRRSTEILKDAVLAKDMDERVGDRIRKVFGNICSYSAATGDWTFAERILALMGTSAGEVPGRFLHPKDYSLMVGAFEQRPDLIEHLRLMMGEVGASPSRGSTEDEKVGTVARLRLEMGFGFLTDEFGHEWFFHRSGFENPADWRALMVGSRVGFKKGRNDKGECATSVRIIPA